MKAKTETTALVKPEIIPVKVVDGHFELVDPKHIKLGLIADEMIGLRTQMGAKYVELCKWVRTNSIPPKEVREVLALKGFNKVRISEINRIAQVTDDMWNEFEAGKLGRDMVLLLERGAEPVETLPPGPSEPGVESALEAGEAGDSGESAEEVSSDEKKKLGMARSAKYILNAAEFLNLKSKKWDLHTGWVLELRRESKADKKLREAKNAKKKTDSKPAPGGPF